MAMSNVVSLLRPGRRVSDTVPGSPSRSAMPTRVGDIGPVRKEIVFEPLPEIPAPKEPPVETPAQPAEEPVPAQP
jgi:hypothetical protein